MHGIDLAVCEVAGHLEHEWLSRAVTATAVHFDPCRLMYRHKVIVAI
jgi:hypothetical protein